MVERKIENDNTTLPTLLFALYSVSIGLFRNFDGI